MLHSSTFRRSLVALALCSTAFAASVTPAAARSHHGSRRYAHAHDMGRHGRRHYAVRHFRHMAHRSRWDAGVAYMRTHRLSSAHASVGSGLGSDSFSGGAAMSGGFGSSDLVSEARRYLGGNPTSRASLWCARFMNMVLQRTGHRGTGSDMASSFASYGQRVSGPEVGAIAVMGRRGGGHVGIITGIDASGNPIMISGNNGNRVREAPISRGRIYAYVMPN
ncbi:TIGR02594 family protein [Bradyrhizobium sp.]|uniref:TIGR02594 family protein n=1 Tax=Bradyrhizobium sp. TaxID=376 RepID=UPI003C317DE4